MFPPGSEGARLARHGGETPPLHGPARLKFHALKIPRAAESLDSNPLVPLHRGFDGLSERTALHMSIVMKRYRGAQPVEPDSADLRGTASRIYLGYSGGAANTFGKTSLRSVIN